MPATSTTQTNVHFDYTLEELLAAKLAEDGFALPDFEAGENDTLTASWRDGPSGNITPFPNPRNMRIIGDTGDEETS